MPQPFTPLVPSLPSRPKSSFFGPAKTSFIRDQFEISTWLCIGALLQGSLLLLVGRLALLPAAALISYRVLDTYAMATGWKRNKYMDGVLMKKFSAQFPDETGDFGSKPANSDVVVFLIGARCNHPLGAFAPGFKQLGDYFVQMCKDLETHAEEFGMLGITSWLNASDRSTSPESMVVAYFRTVEGLHAFAHSHYHREGWDWWNKTYNQHSHLSIYHEVYHVPKGHWESIRVNSHLSGLNSTTFKIWDKESGEERWQNPTVDASKGLLKTSAGRMSRSLGQEHEEYGEDPY